MTAGMGDVEVSEGRDARNRFLPGNKHGAAGRPKGARDRHSRNLLEAFANDFEAHGAAVIEQVRLDKPDVWLRLACDLLPKQATLDVDVSVLHDISDRLTAFRVMNELLGVNPENGLRRLKRIAPQIVDHER